MKINPPKLKKGQKCWGCNKIIKISFCFNGRFWHEKCLEKAAIKRYKDSLKENG